MRDSDFMKKKRITMTLIALGIIIVIIGTIIAITGSNSKNKKPRVEKEIVDLKGIKCKPGQNIADVIDMDDVVLEIDNKSLTNRPDLWGHYGIAREIAAIYNVPLKELPTVKIDSNLPKYKVEIKEPEKCNRYAAIEMDGVYVKESPLWMKVIFSGRNGVSSG